MSYFRVDERCNGCLACVENCPGQALDYLDEGDRRTLLHSMTRCARCGTCYRVCPRDAVQFQHILDGPWDVVTSLQLVRCTRCGEPVYTRTLPADVEPAVTDLVEPLCDEHRARRAARRLAPAASSGEPAKGGTS